MSDPKMPGPRAIRVLFILAIFVAAIWVIVFVGENISHSRIEAEQQRTGGGVPRQP